MLFVPLFCFLFISSSVDANRIFIRQLSPDKEIAMRHVQPKEIYSMPYENFKINIYENSNNEDKSETPSRLKYYYAPVALLDYKTAVSIASSDGKSGQLRFIVEMWNEKVEKNVLNYLRGLLGSDMKPHQVQMIPIDEVSLLTSSATLSKTHSVSSDWIPYNQFQKSLNFSMSCSVKNDCDQLAENMRANPKQFEYLKITMSPTCWNTSLTMGINIVKTEEVPVASCCNGSKTAMDDLKNQLSAALKLFMESKTTVDDLKTQLAETKSQFTERVIVAEKTISNLKTELADSNADLLATKQNLASVTSTLAATNADLLSTKNKLQATSANFDFLMQGNISERFKSMYDDYLITKQNLATVTSNLTATNSNFLTTSAYLATTNTTLTSSLAAMNADLESTKTKLATTNGNLAITNTKLETVTSNVNGFQTKVNDITGRVTITEGNITNLKRDVTTFQTTVNANAPPIYFNVRRSSNFEVTGNVKIPIPFDVTMLNVGGAMNAGTGTFTAPRKGIYFFSWSGNGVGNSRFDTHLCLNGSPMASGGATTDGNEWPTFSIQSTHQLNAGDKVTVQIFQGTGSLYGSYHQFTGFLLQNL